MKGRKSSSAAGRRSKGEAQQAGARLKWPAGEPKTETRLKWYRRVRALKPGMTLDQIARKWGLSRTNARKWALFFGYRPIDTRFRSGGAEKWDRVNWYQRDTDIARELGVSSERVRQFRAQRGLPPSHRKISDVPWIKLGPTYP
jgi:hypothetical protein